MCGKIVTPLCWMLLLLPLHLCFGGEITFEYGISPESVSISQWMGRDVISIPGGAVPFEEGMPALPGESFVFVLPQGCSISKVSIEIHSEEALTDSPLDIIPVEYRTLSTPSAPYTSRIIETGDDIFPVSPVGETFTGSKTGYRVGAFVLIPFRYRPISGALSVITSATVTLEYLPDADAPLMNLSPEQIGIAASGLSGMVDNPEMIDAWAPAERGTDDNWSAWMVIADAGMETVLQPLVDHRSSTAGSAEFVSLDWIYSNYSGWDTQERIRNFLKDAFP